MITLTLLHPGKTVPVQNWTFDTTATIRIGRSMDNEVVLYSAVVSRHHLEIRREGNNWEVVNIGTNGTYVDGQLISKTLATDGMIIRLASSGPKIQIHIPPEESPIQRQLAQLTRSLSSSSADLKSSSAKDTVTNEPANPT
ncbi:FHA domain-containing protein [Crocosphaera sp. UHCC 0190]|uniref:FHA domain-containing protein n=1 Tax=Crocosphaera sp. UHCC 0190 TaxID=3110246 RepID=UPI002B208098|nr:FHA domain-containing protein [Crocosphaera sp. UHCC 0190]MEA5512079.1 FHA domain-containing protein [Crocosphaera sp. UHCC 0190]